MVIKYYEGIPLCHWCRWEVYVEDGEWVGNDDYIAHDECHEMQT